MVKRKSANKRRYYRHWFDRLAVFADKGVRELTRAELAVFILLLRDTKPDGTARASLNDLAERGGMSRSAASRALGSLIGKGKLTVVRRGVTGLATLYTVFPLAVFRELNPIAADWVDGGDGTPVG